MATQKEVNKFVPPALLLDGDDADEYSLNQSAQMGASNNAFLSESNNTGVLSSSTLKSPGSADSSEQKVQLGDGGGSASGSPQFMRNPEDSVARPPPMGGGQSHPRIPRVLTLTDESPSNSVNPASSMERGREGSLSVGFEDPPHPGRKAGGHIKRLSSAMGYVTKEGMATGQARDWPSEIIPSFLFLGGQRAALSQPQMEERGITRYLCCAFDAPLPNHVDPERISSGDVVIKHLKMRDGAKTQLKEHFTEAFQFIRAAKKEKKRIFVYCREGKSRSASIVIAYFIRYMGLTYEEALAAVRCNRSAVDPNFAFCNQLSGYVEEGRVAYTNSMNNHTSQLLVMTNKSRSNSVTAGGAGGSELSPLFAQHRGSGFGVDGTFGFSPAHAFTSGVLSSGIEFSQVTSQGTTPVARDRANSSLLHPPEDRTLERNVSTGSLNVEFGVSRGSRALKAALAADRDFVDMMQNSSQNVGEHVLQLEKLGAVATAGGGGGLSAASLASSTAQDRRSSGQVSSGETPRDLVLVLPHGIKRVESTNELQMQSSDPESIADRSTESLSSGAVAFQNSMNPVTLRLPTALGRNQQHQGNLILDDLDTPPDVTMNTRSPVDSSPQFAVISIDSAGPSVGASSAGSPLNHPGRHELNVLTNHPIVAGRHIGRTDSNFSVHSIEMAHSPSGTMNQQPPCETSGAPSQGATSGAVGRRVSHHQARVSRTQSVSYQEFFDETNDIDTEGLVLSKDLAESFNFGADAEADEEIADQREMQLQLIQECEEDPGEPEALYILRRNSSVPEREFDRGQSGSVSSSGSNQENPLGTSLPMARSETAGPDTMNASSPNGASSPSPREHTQQGCSVTSNGSDKSVSSTGKGDDAMEESGSPLLAVRTQSGSFGEKAEGS